MCFRTTSTACITANEEGTDDGLRLPQGNDEATGNDQRATHIDRRIRPHVKKYQVDDLGDNEKERHSP